MNRYVSLSLLPIFIFASEITISEKNIAIANRSYSYDLNRLRVEANYFKDNFTLSTTIDNETLIGSKFIAREYQFIKNFKPNLPFNPYYKLIDKENFIDNIYLYRAYAKFEIDKSDLTIGLQRVPFGVGRIWTPIDVFNPLNSFSIEPSERVGVFGVNYNYHLDELGKVEFIATLNKNKNIDKKAIRYKKFINFADFGATIVKSDKLDMFGIEIEGNIGESGAEGRVEVGYFKKQSNEYFSGIVGFDYGFTSTNLIWTMEYFFNSKKEKENFNIYEYKPLSKSYIGNILNYEITPLLTSSILSIISLSDKSHYEIFSINYSLSNESDISLSVANYGGRDGSEFNLYEDLIFLSINYFF